MPVGFLVKNEKGFKIIGVSDRNLYEKVLALVPEALEAIGEAISKIK